jgi:hypothetical protein
MFLNKFWAFISIAAEVSKVNRLSIWVLENPSLANLILLHLSKMKVDARILQDVIGILSISSY